jgi:hypothetical protein
LEGEDSIVLVGDNDEPVDWFSNVVIYRTEDEIVISYRKPNFQTILTYYISSGDYLINEYVDNKHLKLPETDKNFYIDQFCQTFTAWYERNKEVITAKLANRYHSNKIAHELVQSID